jgi:DNA excision repair protein ERCC-3
VREDNLIYDLHWLIGPKLYEASWQQLQDEGYIARVRCVEVWCEMTKPFFAEYLRGVEEKNEHLRRALWTCNPTKMNVCEYLIRFHENRGDKIIVFSDNIFILEEFAKKLGRYYICGKVDMSERMQILGAFADSATCNTIFLSKVGDNAIDIPNANVIIQISAHYGSRRQEAQRLGRISRAKSRTERSHSKYNAFFYSLVSRDTQEMYYANRRQQFLVEQGYNYHVLRDQNVDRMCDGDAGLTYSTREAQNGLLKQVLESVRAGDGLEIEQDPEEAALFGETTYPQAAEEPADRPASAAPTPTAPAAPPRENAMHEEQRLSLASLSGGLDGSYMVTAEPRQKRLKTSSSLT